jgi:IS5 family transposase
VYLPTSLEAHQKRFGGAPELLATDRGLYSAENERLAQEAGIKRVVLPKSGHLSHEREQHEKQRWFKRGFRFRAGIEGRISVLRVAPSGWIVARSMERKGWADGLAGAS